MGGKDDPRRRTSKAFSDPSSPLWEEKMTPEDELRRPFPTRALRVRPEHGVVYRFFNILTSSSDKPVALATFELSTPRFKRFLATSVFPSAFPSAFPLNSASLALSSPALIASLNRSSASLTDAI